MVQTSSDLIIGYLCLWQSLFTIESLEIVIFYSNDSVDISDIRRTLLIS
jgi:hypothetical protein